MILEARFVLSRKQYAVNLASMRSGQNPPRHDGTFSYRLTWEAVWFRRQKGVLRACAGVLWDYQDEEPVDGRPALERHADGRSGGDCKARWDGANLWCLENESMREYYKDLLDAPVRGAEIPHNHRGEEHAMKRFILALGIIALAIALGACGKQVGSPVSSPTAAKSVASALATSTVAQQVKTDFEHCWPTGTLAQAHEVHQLAKDTSKHPNGSFATLAGCMHVSRAEEKPFENDVLTAAQHALLSGQLNSKTGREQFVTVTLTGIAAKYDGHAASASPSPGVSR